MFSFLEVVTLSTICNSNSLLLIYLSSERFGKLVPNYEPQQYYDRISIMISIIFHYLLYYSNVLWLQGDSLEEYKYWGRKPFSMY